MSSKRRCIVTLAGYQTKLRRHLEQRKCLFLPSSTRILHFYMSESGLLHRIFMKITCIFQTSFKKDKVMKEETCVKLLWKQIHNLHFAHPVNSIGDRGSLRRKCKRVYLGLYLWFVAHLTQYYKGINNAFYGCKLLTWQFTCIWKFHCTFFSRLNIFYHQTFL